MVSKPNMWITLEKRPLQYFLHLSSKVRQKLQNYKSKIFTEDIPVCYHGNKTV